MPSFNELYKDYSKMVYNLALGYVQNTEDAEEITQDVFVKVYQKIEGFKSDSTLKTWIYRIAINQCIDYVKAKNAKKRFGFKISIFGNEQVEWQLPSDFNHPGVLAENKEATAHIFKAINQLPSKQKAALLLKSVEGLSQKEIAETLMLSEKSVEALLVRGRKTLKTILKKSEG